VLDGEILGAIRRVPRPGGWLCNLSAGGSYEIAEPDAREKEMVRRIAPHLRALGVHYYGVDTLMAADGSRMLSEINTTNAGGAWRYERVTGRPVCQRIADQFVDCALETLREGRLPA
jgi:glutathione synthase